MGSCYITQGAQQGALWQPRRVGWGVRREGGSRGRGHMYTYGWFTLMFGRHQQNSVKQLSFNLKISKFFKYIEKKNTTSFISSSCRPAARGVNLVIRNHASCPLGFLHCFIAPAEPWAPTASLCPRRLWLLKCHLPTLSLSPGHLLEMQIVTLLQTYWIRSPSAVGAGRDQQPMF